MSRKYLFFVLTVLGICTVFPITRADNTAIQTFGGAVTTSGNFGAEIEKEDVSPSWSVEFSHNTAWSDVCNKFIYQNNKLYVQWTCPQYYNETGGKGWNDLNEDGIEAYIIVTFDNDANILDTKYGWVRTIGYGTGNANFCKGDDAVCKQLSWAHFKIRNPRMLTCNFACDHEDKYNYEVRYENKVNGAYALVDPNKGYKCEEIRSVFSPNVEWFGMLTHTCTYNEGGEKIFTVDTISPPTNLLNCADQYSCLAGATEYQLTNETYGKGVQTIPANFVDTVQKTLNTGSDTNVKCSNGICIPYASGTYKFSVNVPESTYYGECRGTPVGETVNGKTFNTPEVKIKTAEVKLPALTSALNLNVINRPPVVNVSFAKDPISVDDQVKVTCDAVDPDSCTDKIVKIKWNCFNDQGKQTNCFFLDDNDIWRASTFSQEISGSNASNPYRATTTFKANQTGGYAVSCEATDDDANNPLSGLGIAGVKVIGNCGEDGYCNLNCSPADPDCSHCGPDGVCVQGCNPEDPDCGVVPSHMKFCAILSDQGSDNTVCGKSAKVNYNAYQYGIKPDQYEWKCSDGDTAQIGGATKECSYSDSGTYVPALRIHDQESNEWVTCNSQGKTNITNEGSCTVGLRKAGSKGEFVNNLQVNIDDEIEAKITKKCLSNGAVAWNIQNGAQTGDDNDSETIKLKFNTAGTNVIKASTQNINCGQAQAIVKEKIQFGL